MAEGEYVGDPLGTLLGTQVGSELGWCEYEGSKVGKNDGCAVGAQSYGVDEHINVTL